MNKDDIIRMAREASNNAKDAFLENGDDLVMLYLDELERFAALAYAEGHKDGLDDSEAVVLPAAIKAEREACARVCMQDASLMRGGTPPQIALMDAAAAIRARGQG